MKQIIYLVNDEGIDGMAPSRTLYASFDEKERDDLLAKDKSKAWRVKAEKIIDTDTAKTQALAKLDGIDRLVLGLPSWVETSTSFKK